MEWSAGAATLVVAIDASAVTFLSIVGPGISLRQAKPAEAAGRRPLLRRPSAAVRRVLTLAGVGGLLD